MISVLPLEEYWETKIPSQRAIMKSLILYCFLQTQNNLFNCNTTTNLSFSLSVVVVVVVGLIRYPVLKKIHQKIFFLCTAISFFLLLLLSPEIAFNCSAFTTCFLPVKEKQKVWGWVLLFQVNNAEL